MELWVGCVAGALSDTEYQQKLAAAGFNRRHRDDTCLQHRRCPGIPESGGHRCGNDRAQGPGQIHQRIRPRDQTSRSDLLWSKLLRQLTRISLRRLRRTVWVGALCRVRRSIVAQPLAPGPRDCRAVVCNSKLHVVDLIDGQACKQCGSENINAFCNLSLPVADNLRAEQTP